MTVNKSIKKKVNAEKILKNIEKISLDDFPDREFNIKNFSANAGGIKNNSEAINDAIKKCHQNGGGKVIIPPGIWLTGPIYLQNNINLHLQKGAMLLFSKDYQDYPLIETTYEGKNQIRCTSPINGKNLKNIAITGSGIIDGSGEVWRPVKKIKVTETKWRELVDSGGAVDEENKIWWPTENALRGREILNNLKERNASLEEYKKIREYLRPVLLSLINCDKVLLDGPIFQNSPAWNIHPLMCTNMEINNIIVRNESYAQNGDGLDLDSCKNIYVHDSIFDVGDDAICIKSGKNEEGRKRGQPCESLLIEDCTVYSGHGGFVIGSEMSGGVRNIRVRNCTFMGTQRGLRFKTTRGRGGVVENIYISNINMSDIKEETILFNMYYGGSMEKGLFEKEPVDETTPVVRKIYMENIVSRKATRAIKLIGLPEMPVSQIYLDNAVISADRGIECKNGRDISFKNVELKIRDNMLMDLVQTKKVRIEKCDLDFNKTIKISGEESDNIDFIGYKAKEIDNILTKENVNTEISIQISR